MKSNTYSKDIDEHSLEDFHTSFRFENEFHLHINRTLRNFEESFAFLEYL